MVLQITGEIEIENLRQYPAETVEKLRALLAAGAEAEIDPQRKYFYDVQNCSQVFFIHISPISGKVMLLANWRKASEPTLAQSKACAA